MTRLLVPFAVYVACWCDVCVVVEQDRDAVIAVVEDARAAQEREAERLRDKLSGFGKTLTPLAPRTNGTAGAATANGGGLRELSLSEGGEGDRDDLVDSAEVRVRFLGQARQANPTRILTIPYTSRYDTTWYRFLRHYYRPSSFVRQTDGCCDARNNTEEHRSTRGCVGRVVRFGLAMNKIDLFKQGRWAARK